MNIILKNDISSLYNKENNAVSEENKIIGKSSDKDVLKENVEKLKEAMEKGGFKTEEEKKAYESKLDEKIKNGAKLSAEEMNYLQRTNPMMYMRVKRIQMQRELLSNRLKQCRSKKEVEETYSQAMASIDKKDPDKELVMKAYDNVTKEFKKTKEYKELPAEEKNKKDQKGIMKNETTSSFNVKC